MSNDTIDANGAFHSQGTGRFADYRQAEVDPELILARKTVAESEAIIRRAWVQDRLASINQVVEGIELPTERDPFGSRSFGKANPAVDILTAIEGVPKHQAHIRAEKARGKELAQSLVDFPDLPECSKEAIRREVKMQMDAVKDAERELTRAKQNRHVVLWEARMEIERCTAELAREVEA